MRGAVGGPFRRAAMPLLTPLGHYRRSSEEASMAPGQDFYVSLACVTTSPKLGPSIVGKVLFEGAVTCLGPVQTYQGVVANADS